MFLRLTSATLDYTQLQESLQNLEGWLEQAEAKADVESDMENTQRLELLQVTVLFVSSSVRGRFYRQRVLESEGVFT